uniref:Putative secreted protein n=1 Tax=Panstrongylus lignarius TaxID=156445 RepID=A0A224Y4E0_9HEMI
MPLLLDSSVFLASSLCLCFLHFSSASLESVSVNFIFNNLSCFSRTVLDDFRSLSPSELVFFFEYFFFTFFPSLPGKVASSSPLDE